MFNLKYAIFNFMWGMYGRYAWDRSFGQEAQDLIDKLTLHLLRQRKNTDELVLDAGCGTGNYSLSFARSGFQVHGIDSAGAMIQVANSKIADAEAGRLVFQRLSLDDPLPYEDAAFDHIVCVSVLQLLTNPLFTIREFARLLKPSGHLIVVHFDRSSQPPETSDSGSSKGSHEHASTPVVVLAKLKRLLERSGLVHEVTYGAIKNLVERANSKIVVEEGSSPKILVAVR
jgi:ubiquinone/menaquinone biosynthesis C-methylase UbiE